jgi:hypothetical protein
MLVIGTALSCPKCRRESAAMAWRQQDGRCPQCGQDFTFYAFPALTARVAVVAPQIAVPEDAVCFFHAENKAESICESCGRFLCGVCGINFAGKKLCPSCIATTKATDTKLPDSRVLYDGIALSIAVFSLLIWPITVVTAPVALGFVVTGWRRPGSLVRGNRTRLVIAGLIALIEIAGWLFLLGALIFHHRMSGYFRSTHL